MQCVCNLNIDEPQAPITLQSIRLELESSNIQDVAEMLTSRGLPPTVINDMIRMARILSEFESCDRG